MYDPIPIIPINRKKGDGNKRDLYSLVYNDKEHCHNKSGLSKEPTIHGYEPKKYINISTSYMKEEYIVVLYLLIYFWKIDVINVI